jgi:hypothetical protein
VKSAHYFEISGRNCLTSRRNHPEDQVYNYHSVITSGHCTHVLKNVLISVTSRSRLNFTQEKIKSRFKSGNACYQSVQNLLSSTLLSINKKSKIYRTIILSIVFYCCENLWLTLREERRLRVFENRVLR